MRIWDIAPEKLCRAHLLGEHRELHAIWSILTRGKKGYARHPETLRWKGGLKALYRRHERLLAEMKRRGYRHLSPLERRWVRGRGRQRRFVDTPAAQAALLRRKGCGCCV
ncbi:MAG: pyrimidine dimer DNA glycosylase/endonuclease V [Deltaproteobacteria bacterium]